MMKQDEQSGLDLAVARVKDLRRAGPVTLGALSEALDERGHALLALFLCLPFAQPIPLAGLSSLIGPVIFLAGIFLACDRNPWLPKSWRARVLSESLLDRLIRSGEKAAQLGSKVFRVRLTVLTEGVSGRVLLGTILALSAVLLALPLPIPFTNTLPAFAILFAAVAILERDGLCSIASIASFAAAVTYFYLLAQIPDAVAAWCPSCVEWILSEKP